MAEVLYSVGEVAKHLDVHVRTIRNFVRDGRLKAIRVGKQYRIAAEDLATMTGRPAGSFEPAPVRRHRHVEVSSIVEIDAISPETTMRITNNALGVAKGRGTRDDRLRIDTIYDDERARLKVVILGSMDATVWILRLIQVVLESEK